MSFRFGLEHAAPAIGSSESSLPWLLGVPDRRSTLGSRAACAGPWLRHCLPDHEARRVRHVIEQTIGDIFGVSHCDIGQPSRGKAPVAHARQVAMYLAHVCCGMTLTEVGAVFARDRTTVAHACAVIEDRRDDPVFDRALELMEWIVPTLAGCDLLHAARDI